MDMHAHILRQMAFSRGAFGPGERRKSIIDHIRKELVEIEESDGSPDEWVDVALLALDGLWRSIDRYSGSWSPETIASVLESKITTKQGVNERRHWPDWRALKDREPSEHVR